MAKVTSVQSESLTLGELIEATDIPREMYPEFHRLRVEAFAVAQQVFDDRAKSYNVDHQPWQEQVFGPVSLASEIFKRARRMAALLSPIRKDPIRRKDLNHIIDACIDITNYLSWVYALLIIATGLRGHANNDDAPGYLDRLPRPQGDDKDAS